MCAHVRGGHVLQATRHGVDEGPPSGSVYARNAADISSATVDNSAKAASSTCTHTEASEPRGQKGLHRVCQREDAHSHALTHTLSLSRTRAPEGCVSRCVDGSLKSACLGHLRARGPCKFAAANSCVCCVFVNVCVCVCVCVRQKRQNGHKTSGKRTAQCHTHTHLL